MKKLPPLWTVTTGVCLVFVLWTYTDIVKEDWVDTALDAALSVWWFFLAHISWERRGNEK